MSQTMKICERKIERQREETETGDGEFGFMPGEGQQLRSLQCVNFSKNLERNRESSI